MSAVGRCAARDNKEAASPLTTGRLPRSRPGDAPREGTGPPHRPQCCCASPAGDGPAGPALTRRPLRPLRQETPAGPGLPRPWRGASGEPVPTAQTDARNQR